MKLALAGFDELSDVHRHLVHEVEGARVHLLDYDWVRKTTRGPSITGRRILLFVRHPDIDGEAICKPRPTDPAWKVVLFIARLSLIWLFVPVWIYQRLRGGYAREVRVDDFDPRFEVWAKSKESATRALPPKMRALARTLPGPIEVRTGIAAVELPFDALTKETEEASLAIAKTIVHAYAIPPSLPGVAYRLDPKLE